MPFDEGLAERLEAVLGSRPDCRETRMFGGFGYLLQGNMCVGIYKDFLIVRVGPEIAQKLLQTPHVSPMDITGKPMKGWAKVAPEGTAEDEDLAKLCGYAVDFVATLPAKKKAR